MNTNFKNNRLSYIDSIQKENQGFFLEKFTFLLVISLSAIITYKFFDFFQNPELAQKTIQFYVDKYGDQALYIFLSFVFSVVLLSRGPAMLKHFLLLLMPKNLRILRHFK